MHKRRLLTPPWTLLCCFVPLPSPPLPSAARQQPASTPISAGQQQEQPLKARGAAPDAREPRKKRPKRDDVDGSGSQGGDEGGVIGELGSEVQGTPGQPPDSRQRKHRAPRVEPDARANPRPRRNCNNQANRAIETEEELRGGSNGDHVESEHHQRAQQQNRAQRTPATEAQRSGEPAAGTPEGLGRPKSGVSRSSGRYNAWVELLPRGSGLTEPRKQQQGNAPGGPATQPAMVRVVLGRFPTKAEAQSAGCEVTEVLLGRTSGPPSLGSSAIEGGVPVSQLSLEQQWEYLGNPTSHPLPSNPEPSFLDPP